MKGSPESRVCNRITGWPLFCYIPFFFLFLAVGHDGILQVFQVDIDPPQMLARSEEMVALDKNEDFR